MASKKPGTFAQFPQVNRAPNQSRDQICQYSQCCGLITQLWIEQVSNVKAVSWAVVLHALLFIVTAVLAKKISEIGPETVPD